MNDNTKNIESMVVLVTPDLASQWLKKNTKNRKVRKMVVNSYAEDMKNGNWSLIGDSITFDEDGVLTNGQHRLYAITKSETSQYFNVMKGVPHNMCVDRPAVRSVGDNLSMFTDLPDVFSQNYVIGMCRFILRYLGIESRSITPTYLFMKTFQTEIENYFNDIGIGQRKANRYRNSPILSAFFLAYINGVSSDILLKARKTFVSGEYVYDDYDIDRFIPIIKLDKVVNASYFKTHAERYSIFLRTLFAIHSVADNKYLKQKNRESDEIVYDIEYNGKKLSDRHEIIMLNMQNKKNI